MSNIATINHAPELAWNRDRIDLIKTTFCKGSTDQELELFVSTCKRLQLSPEARQVFAVKRWDSRERREVMSIQVSIDGFRLVAERSGKYAGQLGPFWCGKDGQWREVWLEDNPPQAAKVGILRDDFKEPVWGIATWKSYCQTNKQGQPTPMWKNMGDVMLAKCAEALGLRKAFPHELSGVYTNDEMQQAHTPHEPIQVQETIEAPKPDPMTRTEKMLATFVALGANRQMVEDQVGSDILAMTPENFEELQGIYQGLKAGEFTVDDWAKNLYGDAAEPSPDVNPVDTSDEVKAQQINDLF